MSQKTILMFFNKNKGESCCSPLKKRTFSPLCYAGGAPLARLLDAACANALLTCYSLRPSAESTAADGAANTASGSKSSRAESAAGTSARTTRTLPLH